MSNLREYAGILSFQHAEPKTLKIMLEVTSDVHRFMSELCPTIIMMDHSPMLSRCVCDILRDVSIVLAFPLSCCGDGEAESGHESTRGGAFGSHGCGCSPHVYEISTFLAREHMLSMLTITYPRTLHPRSTRRCWASLDFLQSNKSW